MSVKRWLVGKLPQGAVLPVQSALWLLKLLPTYQRPANTSLLDIFVSERLAWATTTYTPTPRAVRIPSSITWQLARTRAHRGRTVTEGRQLRKSDGEDRDGRGDRQASFPRLRSALPEFECNLISERTQTGLVAD